jgi:hypothetical protein
MMDRVGLSCLCLADSVLTFAHFACFARCLEFSSCVRLLRAPPAGASCVRLMHVSRVTSSRSVQKKVRNELLVARSDCVLIEISDAGFA